jgi:hypothetical protein
MDAQMAVTGCGTGLKSGLKGRTKLKGASFGDKKPPFWSVEV